jgi:hypothetical protein
MAKGEGSHGWTSSDLDLGTLKHSASTLNGREEQNHRRGKTTIINGVGQTAVGA